MAASQTLRKVGQVFSGAFLGLTGSWLLVICVGGLLTLGVLSLFHLGVLLSLGCIGVCLCVAGACWLCNALFSQSPYSTSEEPTSDWLFQEEGLKKPQTDDSARWRFHPEKNRTDVPETPSATFSRRSYNPFH